ncbi:MAG: hypothetical protein CSA20_09630 [Deltaproteobacteria bacterium]|nr:MAG: hypothetical protein CSA20_09630 [Deltaproteobacteria bacterium]
MKKMISGISLFLLMSLTAPSWVAAYGEKIFGDDSIYAIQAGAGKYPVKDQIIKCWGDGGTGNPIEVGTQTNKNVTVIQGMDQNWGGTANIMPGLVTYDNVLGAPDYAATGWGGAASGGTIIIVFDEDIGDGTDDVIGSTGINYGGIDFMVHGFGFAFNKAFSLERGTFKVYAATADYNPIISVADPDGPGPLGEVTIIGDESQWVLLSEYGGYADWDNNPATPETWQGNPDMNYGSAPGAYGEYIWGDLADGGLSKARYIKIELGDGGHYIDPFTGRQNNGRALFIDAVEARRFSNTAPVLASIGDQEVDEEEELSFTIVATDKDNDNITYSYHSEVITDAFLDSSTGQFSWTPGAGTAGIYSVTFTATDDGEPSKTDTKTIQISVGDVNHPPVFAPNQPADAYDGLAGNLITFTVSATDTDGDYLTYEASPLPTGATFSGTTFSWQTDYEDAGEYMVTITATDNGSPQPKSTSKEVAITIQENHAPEFESNKPRATYAGLEGTLLTFTVSATDEDGDALTYEALNLPPGATFSGTTFSWQTGYEDAGTYTVTIQATDDRPPVQSTSKQVVITIGDKDNHRPEFVTNQPAATYARLEGDLITITILATDKDGDALIYDALNLPPGATFSGTTFSWQTDYEDAGTCTVTFKATDNGTPVPMSTSKEVTLIIENKENHAPEFEPNKPATTYARLEGKSIVFTVSATDRDGDALTYEALNLPPGAKFLGDTFSWQTDDEDAGTYKVGIQAIDNGVPEPMSTSKEVTLIIAEKSDDSGDSGCFINLLFK